MKTVVFILLLVSFLISSCAPSQLFGPTLTLMPASRSATLLSAPTPIPVTAEPATPSPSPTPPPTATRVPITPVALGTQLPASGAMISSENVSQLSLFAHWGNGNCDDAIYTPKGDYLIVACSTGIYFYDGRDFSLVKTIDLKEAIFHVALTPNGEKLAATSFDKVFVFEMGTDTPVFMLADTHVVSLAFSPDSKTLAFTTHDDDDTLHLWDMDSQKFLRKFDTIDSWMRALAFSPNGKYLVFGDYATRTYNLDGKMLDSHGPYVSGGATFDLSFSTDGSLLAEAAYTSGSIVHVWRVLENGRLVIYRNISPMDWVTPPPQNYIHTDSVRISPDGKWLAIGGSSVGILIWDLGTGALVKKLGAEARHKVMAWSPDSKYLVSSNEDNGIEIWGWQTGRLVTNLGGLTGPIEMLAWSPDGRQIVSGARNGTTSVLDAQTGGQLRTFEGNIQGNTFAFSVDGKTLAIRGSHGGYNTNGGMIRILDGTDGAQQKFLSETLGAALAAESFSRDGDYLVTDGFANIYTLTKVQIWRTADWSLLNSWVWGGDSVNQLVFCPDGKTVALSDDKSPAIWFYTIHDGKPAQKITLTSGWARINAFSFSPNGQTLLSLSDDYFPEEERQRKVLRLWRVSDGTLIYSVNGDGDLAHKDYMFQVPRLYADQSAIAWSPSGDIFAVGMPDGMVQIRQASDGRKLQTLSGHTMNVAAVTFSPDGHLLASGSLDGTIRIWGILP